MAAIALTATALTADIAHARLISPLDVRVDARVVPGTVLRGAWNVFVTPEAGAWRGPNLALTETWQPGAREPIRIRGRRSGGAQRVHYVKVNYLKARQGAGMLTSVPMDTDNSEPTVLQCKAQRADGPGDIFVEPEQTSMQVVDDPRRNRVVVRGPGIAFLGPECRPAGQELPVRGVGLHPFEAERPWTPKGALTPWQFSVPRAEFAAGGTFRFRGRYSYGQNIEDLTTQDLAGTQLTSGTVAVDLKVRRIGR